MTSNDFIFLYIVNMVKVEQAKITILMYTEMFLLITFFFSDTCLSNISSSYYKNNFECHSQDIKMNTPFMGIASHHPQK